MRARPRTARATASSRCHTGLDIKANGRASRSGRWLEPSGWCGSPACRCGSATASAASLLRAG
eukprot:2409088-Heterocapsa_arctica.AAC.1